MFVIDRYVVSTFLSVFIIGFLSLSGIYIVSDFVSNLSEFVDYSQTEGGLLLVLVSYYAARLPWFFDLMSPVVALTAAVFVITWLQRHNEMAAIMAAGRSVARIIAPLIAVSFVISLMAAANRELVIPAVRDRLCRNAQDWVGDGGRRVDPVYDQATGILILGQKSFHQQRSIFKPSFQLPPGLTPTGRRLTASEARYLDPRPGHPGGYLLSRVEHPSDLLQQPSVRIGDQPVIFTPVDTAWLKKDQCFVVSAVPFEQLENGIDWHRYSSTRQLVAGLRSGRPGLDADLRVIVHSRVIQPILDMSLLLLGIPIVVTRNSRNVFVAIGLCVLVVLVFSICVLMFRALGSSYLISPVLAAWIPVLLFVPGAAALSAGWLR